MKILLLCWRDSTHPQGGGSERYLERVGEYLAAQGHEVRVQVAGVPFLENLRDLGRLQTSAVAQQP